MKNILITIGLVLLALTTTQCQPKDSTVVLNIIVDSTFNECAFDTTRIHYIINYIPSDTVCSPVIIADSSIALLWYSYEIDSTWLGVNLPDGDLPRRSNGTYLYWKTDSLGNLIPRRTLKYYTLSRHPGEVQDRTASDSEPVGMTPERKMK